MNKQLILGLMIANLAEATQIKTIDEGRLSFTVSEHDLNRIEIKNDRIQQIFGNKGTFITEYDQEMGHLYLKPAGSQPVRSRPSRSVGSRPISLTIVSEKGVVQDLLLLPIDCPGETLILKAKDPLMGNPFMGNPQVGTPHALNPIEEAETFPRVEFPEGEGSFPEEEEAGQ
jgi:hypothetical protein